MANDANTSEFLKLLTSHDLRLRAFALSLVPNWADAEEVVQQAYLTMWQKFGGFEPGTSFFSWAARFVHLTALDFRKRQRRGRNVIQFGTEFADVVAQETLAAAEELAEREAVLSGCIGKLKPRQRELLELRYQAGSRGEQVAEAMGMTADAVYQSLARIRKALQDCVHRGLGRERGLA